MYNKIISIFLSAVMTLSAFGAETAKKVFEIVFPNAYSINFEKNEFLEDIDDEDIFVLNKDSGYVRNIVMLFFEEDASFFEKLDALHSIDGKVIGSLPDANLCVIKTKNKTYSELIKVCNEAEKHEAVAVASISPARKIAEQYTPNDSFEPWTWNPHVWDESNPKGYNWHLEAIEARNAWAYNNYFNHINIGILDSGFMTEHEDLQGKIIFPSEYEESKNKARSHGTHVAGILAALGDNEKGICGVCQNSTLIAINWDTGWASSLSILFNVGTVVKAGAKVINMSLGSSGALDDDEWYWMNILNEMEGMIYSYYMGSLLNRGFDFIVVQSSGNGNGTGNPIDSYQNGSFCCVTDENARAPLGVEKKDIIDRIIVVGACYYEDGKYIQASSSNVGENVDIVAPGENVFGPCTSGYTSYSGTSSAAPIVSGVLSLVWSVNEKLSGSEVASVVLNSTKHFAEPYESYKFGEYLLLRDLPVVNARLAVERVISETYDVREVSKEVLPLSEVTFKNILNNHEFVFSADADGMLNCLLESGEYAVYVDGELKENILVA